MDLKVFFGVQVIWSIFRQRCICSSSQLAHMILRFKTHTQCSHEYGGEQIFCHLDQCLYYQVTNLLEAADIIIVEMCLVYIYICRLNLPSRWLSVFEIQIAIWIPRWSEICEFERVSTFVTGTLNHLVSGTYSYHSFSFCSVHAGTFST